MWYRTGQANFTNASTTVTGVGTSWIDGASVGEGILGPDNRVYEIASIASNTSLTIGSGYLGTTASNSPYQIVPTQSYIRDLAAQAAELVANYGATMAAVGTGKFDDGTATQPGVRFTADENTGIRRVSSDTMALVAGGADKVTVSPSGVSGITKADVGLSNVDNISDANKPVSTATQTALDLKLNAANPSYTGTLTGGEIEIVGGYTGSSTGYTVPAGQTIQIAEGSGLNGTYSIFANGPAGPQHICIQVAAHQFDSAATLNVLANHGYNAGFCLGNFRVAGDAAGGSRALLMTNITGGDVTVSRVTAIGSGHGKSVVVNPSVWTITIKDAPTTYCDRGGNLGLGTASPYGKLDVAGTAPTLTIRDTQQKTWLAGDSVGSLDFYTEDTSGDGARVVSRIRSVADDGGTAASSGAIGFWTCKNGTPVTERARIDSSGNLGIGVTPSAWGGGVKAIEINTYSSVYDFTSGYNGLIANAYHNGDWRYKGAGPAVRYEQSTAEGSHKWSVAPSGTAGNPISFTQAMSLNANGTLAVTPSVTQASVFNHPSGAYSTWQYGGTSVGDIGTANQTISGGLSGTDFGIVSRSGNLILGAAGNLVTLDTSGNLGLGVTPSAWGAPFKGFDVNTGGGIGGTGTSIRLFANSYYNGSNYIYKNSAAAARYDVIDAQHIWYTAPSGTAGNPISFTQAMTLDASGNLGIGSSSPTEKLDVVGNIKASGAVVDVVRSLKPSLSVDWTQKPTAAALTAAGWTIARTGEITSFGLPTKAAENLFVQSQDFANAAWTKTRQTITAVTDESGLVGVLAVPTAETNSHYLFQSLTNTNIGSATYRVRFLCKAAGYTKVFIHDPSTARAGAIFDVGTGTTVGSGLGAGYVSHSIAAHELGGGLYWCEMVMTSSSAGTNWNGTVTGIPDAYSPATAGSNSFTGDGINGIEVYAAQLQQGFDGDYIPTTDSPITLYEPQLVTTAANELAYQHNANGECIGLVQYPADTNLILQSQDLSNASWSKSAVAVTASKRKWAGNVPFWRVAKTATGTASLFQITSITALAAITPYTITIALMADQWSGCTSAVIGVSNNTAGTWPSQSAVVVSGPGSVSVGGAGPIAVTGLSTTVPTLVRLTAQMQVGAASMRTYIYPENNSTGTLGAAILATRVHLSASPRLMPYIPTTTAAVTRGAQSITLSGSAFTAVNNPAQGTLLVKASVEDAVFDITRMLCLLQMEVVSTSRNRIGLASAGAAAQVQSFVTRFDATQASDTNIGSISTTPQTIAYSFANNAFTPAMNGVVDATDTSGGVPPVDKLKIGWSGSANDAAYLYQRTELYPRAMTSAELAAITTPGVL